MVFFFFFSSRRRHTRLQGDWSSDVCSSDLIARDITEKKRLEQQVLNAEKLASIGKLAAGVAHEINNPLGGILNCLYNLRKKSVSLERATEYLASMEEGLRRVQKIVRQLLDFSQQHDP